MVCASQVLASALWRRYGFGSLTHRGWHPCNRPRSRVLYTANTTALRAKGRAVNTTAFISRYFCNASQWQRLGTAIAKMHASHSQLLRKDGSMSAGALDVGIGSLAHRGLHHSSVRVSVRTLRQNYITPHCIKCRFSRSQAPFVSLHRFAPFGFTQQALCKVAFAGAVASRLHFPVASRPTCSPLAP